MGKFIITEEERLRIQGLYPQLNKKSINEQNQSSHCTGNNTIDSSLIKFVRQNTKIPTQYNFLVKAYFGRTKSGTDVYKDLLTNLKSKVLDVATANQKQGLSDGRLELSIIKIAYVRTSASNYLNGPLNPTHWNGGGKISSGYEGTVPNIKVPIKDSSHKDWKENEGYAKSRWSKFANWAKQSGGKLGITFGSNVNEVTPNIRITDTGGCTDENRDISKYKNPGQFLQISGIIQFKRKEIPERPDEELLECAKGLKIVVGFFDEPVSINSEVTMKKNKSTHKCDYATFNVYCNKIYVGTANMNNDKQRFRSNGSKRAKVGLNQKNVVHEAPQKLGGTVYNTISVDGELLKKVIAKNKNGFITIEMKGTENTLTRGGKYHGDAPMVAAFTVTRNKIRLVYDSKEPYKSKNTNRPNDVSGSEYQTIATFNPCNNVKTNQG